MDFLAINLEPHGHATRQPSSYRRSCPPLCLRHIVIKGYYVSHITFCGIFNPLPPKKSSFVGRTGCNFHENTEGRDVKVPQAYGSRQKYITKQQSCTRGRKQMCVFTVCMSLHVCVSCTETTGTCTVIHCSE